MVIEASAFVEEWRQAVSVAPNQDISQRMMEVTANIVLKTLFSTSNPTDLATLYQLMNEAQDYVMKRTIKPFFIPFMYLNGEHRKFLKSKAIFDGLVYDMIKTRRTSSERPYDLLSLLLESVDEDTGAKMTDAQLRDESITIFAAGHETSANALAWILWLLAKNPDAQAIAAQEAMNALNQKTPDLKQLASLSYIMQVIQEGMRLYPPAYAVGREAINEDEILGYPIPKKSILFLSIYALHRDPEYWEQPNKFYPAHFETEKVKERPRLAYMPFGAGPRMCIGNHFALMEMQLIVALLLKNFRFSPGQESPEMNPLITLKPKPEIFLKVELR